MRSVFEKLLGTEPVRLALIVALAAVAVVAAVLVSTGVTDKETLLWAVGALAASGVGVDRFNRTSKGAWSPSSVDEAIEASHAHTGSHVEPDSEFA